LIEDHLNGAVAELRIHTNYFETYESDFTEMLTCLKAVESGIDAAIAAAKSSAVSYGGSPGYSSGGRSSKNGGYGRGYGSGSNSAIEDYSSPYQGPGITFTNGTGAIGYATYNITPGILGTQRNPGLKPGPHGFATGGQIMAGEDQRVEFFKKNSERVIIVDDKKVSDGRGGGGSGSSSGDRPIIINPVFNNAQLNDPRSRQQVMDDIRRTVRQVMLTADR
ncbi:hypothetical protein ACE04B_36315, partial [Rhizobium phaseoli]